MYPTAAVLETSAQKFYERHLWDIGLASLQVRRNEDCKDGTYVVSWVPPAPGDYEISVSFKGTFGGVAGAIRGSPLTARFQKGQPADNNTMPGPAMIKQTAADVNTLLQFATKVNRPCLFFSQLDSGLKNTLISRPNQVTHVAPGFYFDSMIVTS